jgi:hypothetical protein
LEFADTPHRAFLAAAARSYSKGWVFHHLKKLRAASGAVA